jgi:integrase/recombinase XerC
VRPARPVDLSDPVALLLADKRSPQTRRAYAADLRAFFGGEPAPSAVMEFVSLQPAQIALRVTQWKGQMLSAGLAEATVNRRLAAVRSLLKMCQRLGLAQTDGKGLVDGEKVQAYRDTRGIELEQMQRLLRAPRGDKLRARRDRAILRLLLENGLRRAEVAALDVNDFERTARRLLILGKGRGTSREPVTLSRATVDAIAAYLEAAGHEAGALFRNVSRDRAVAGSRLSAEGIYQLVARYGARIGIPKLTPHKLRHSCLTAALEATAGDVRKVQKLSRHKNIQTLLIYDDRRRDDAGDLTRQLSALLGEDE